MDIIPDLIREGNLEEIRKEVERRKIMTYLAIISCYLLESCTEGNFEIFLYFACMIEKVHNFNCQELIKAIRSGNEDIINYLLDRNADLFNSEGCPFPLPFCIMEGKIELAFRLIERDINLSERDGKGSIALAESVRSGYMDMAELLLDKGVNHRFVNRNGQNLLHQCSHNKNFKLMEKLLKLDLDINLRDNIGFTPIMTSCTRGYKNIFELLLKHGADLNIVGNYGSSCLHIAASRIDSGNICIIKYLIKSKPELMYLKDHGGDIPLHKAVSELDMEAVRIFLDEDLSLKDVKNNKEETSLDIARNKNMIFFTQLEEIIAELESWFKPVKN